MYYSKVKDPRDANQITRAYMDAILIEPRYLDSVVPDISMELYGRAFASPVMIAAFSHLNGTHPEGMVEMARGAQLGGVCNWAGMGSEEELSRILVSGAVTIKIIKPYADRERIFAMMEHARAEGALAVGIDIDHSFGGTGYFDVVLGEAMKPLTREELRGFCEATPLPFIVKGVLSAQDALKCRDAGVRGILLSHHHGIVPYAVPPLMALPGIRAAVGKSMDIFVDCGIDTGSDVFKALALGAKAVCVGRCILPALKARGAEGVREYLDGMADELRALMARTCCKDLRHIPQDVLWNSLTGKPLRD